MFLDGYWLDEDVLFFVEVWIMSVNVFCDDFLVMIDFVVDFLMDFYVVFFYGDG